MQKHFTPLPGGLSEAVIQDGIRFFIWRMRRTQGTNVLNKAQSDRRSMSPESAVIPDFDIGCHRLTLDSTASAVPVAPAAPLAVP